MWLLILFLLGVAPAGAESGFDEKYERDYNIFNPANRYAPDNPLNPAQAFGGSDRAMRPLPRMGRCKSLQRSLQYTVMRDCYVVIEYSLMRCSRHMEHDPSLVVRFEVHDRTERGGRVYYSLSRWRGPTHSSCDVSQHCCSDTLPAPPSHSRRDIACFQREYGYRV